MNLKGCVIVLDIRAIRADASRFKTGLARKKANPALIDELLTADEAWRHGLAEVEQLKSRRNQASEAIAAQKKQGQNAADEIAEMRIVSDRIKVLDEEVKQHEATVKDLLLAIPNIPHASVPDGDSEVENVPLRHMGVKPQFTFEPKAHFEIAQSLNIVDFERGVKITGSRFVTYLSLIHI